MNNPYWNLKTQELLRSMYQFHLTNLVIYKRKIIKNSYPVFCHHRDIPTTNPLIRMHCTRRVSNRSAHLKSLNVTSSSFRQSESLKCCAKVINTIFNVRDELETNCFVLLFGMNKKTKLMQKLYLIFHLSFSTVEKFSAHNCGLDGL